MASGPVWRWHISSGSSSPARSSFACWVVTGLALAAASGAGALALLMLLPAPGRVRLALAILAGVLISAIAIRRLQPRLWQTFTSGFGAKQVKADVPAVETLESITSERGP